MNVLRKIQTENQYYFENIESVTKVTLLQSFQYDSALDIDEDRSRIRVAENNLSQLTIDFFSDVDYWECDFLRILDPIKGKKKFVYQSFSGDAIFGLFILLSVMSDNLKNKEKIATPRRMGMMSLSPLRNSVRLIAVELSMAIKSPIIREKI